VVFALDLAGRAVTERAVETAVVEPAEVFEDRDVDPDRLSRKPVVGFLLDFRYR
jgi:hypothetical protein